MGIHESNVYPYIFTAYYGLFYFIIVLSNILWEVNTMNKKFTNKKFYFIYIISIIGFIYLGNFTIENNISHWDRSFVSYKKKDLVFTFYPLFLGFILNIEHIIREKNKEGTWKLNKGRLLIMGIPMLILSSAISMYYLDIPIISRVYFFVFHTFYWSEFLFTYIAIFKLILGYTITTSFYKS